MVEPRERELGRVGHGKAGVGVPIGGGGGDLCLSFNCESCLRLPKLSVSVGLS